MQQRPVLVFGEIQTDRHAVLGHAQCIFKGFKSDQQLGAAGDKGHNVIIVKVLLIAVGPEIVTQVGQHELRRRLGHLFCSTFCHINPLLRSYLL